MGIAQKLMLVDLEEILTDFNVTVVKQPAKRQT